MNIYSKKKKNRKLNTINKLSKKKGGKPLESSKPLNQYTHSELVEYVINTLQFKHDDASIIGLGVFKDKSLDGTKFLSLSKVDIIKMVSETYAFYGYNPYMKQRSDKVIDLLIQMHTHRSFPEGGYYWPFYTRLTPEIIKSMSNLQITELVLRRAGINQFSRCIQSLIISKPVTSHDNYNDQWTESIINEQLQQIEYFRTKPSRAKLIKDAFIEIKYEANEIYDPSRDNIEFIYKFWVYQTLHKHKYMNADVVGDGAVLVQIPDGWTIAPGDDTDIEVCALHPWGVQTLVFDNVLGQPCLICGTALHHDPVYKGKRSYWDNQLVFSIANTYQVHSENDLLLRKLRPLSDFDNNIHDIHTFLTLETLSSTQIAHEVAKGDLHRWFEPLSLSQMDGYTLSRASITQLNEILNSIDTLRDQTGVKNQIILALINCKLTFLPSIVYKNGNRYTGSVNKNCFKHGYGVLVDKSNGLIYKGPWVDDKPDTGTIDLSNSKSYGITDNFCGEFKEGKKHGMIWHVSFELNFLNFKTGRSESKIDLLKCTFEDDKLNTTKKVSFPANYAQRPDIPFAYCGNFNDRFIPHHPLSPPAIVIFESEIYHTFFNDGKIDGLAYITDKSGRIIRVEQWNNGVKTTSKITFDNLTLKLVDAVEYNGFLHAFSADQVGPNGYKVYNTVFDYLIKSLPTPTSYGYPISSSQDILTFTQNTYAPELRELNRFSSSNIIDISASTISAFAQAFMSLHTTPLYSGMSVIDNIPKNLFEVACIHSFTQIDSALSIFKFINNILRNDVIRNMTIGHYIKLLSNPVIISLIRGLLKCPEIKNAHIQQKIKEDSGNRLQFTYIYRCIRLTVDTSVIYKNLIVGNYTTFCVFQSFTSKLNRSIIGQFGSTLSEPVLLIFRLQTITCSARYISHFSAFSRENEILTLPNILYQIIDVQIFAQSVANRGVSIKSYFGPREVEMGDTEYSIFDQVRSDIIIITMSEIDQETSHTIKNDHIQILRGGYYE